MTSRKYGLPPQYPSIGRRGSNTPVPPAMVPSSNSQFTQNRSRSLDGLLDSEQILKTQDLSTGLPAPPPPVATDNTPSENVNQVEKCCSSTQPLQSHELSVDNSGAVVTCSPTVVKTPERNNLETTISTYSKNGSSSINKEHSSENNLEVPNEAACDINKSSMLSLYSNSSDSKRKRNFMDKCVNKVRSLIKK